MKLARETIILIVSRERSRRERERENLSLKISHSRRHSSFNLYRGALTFNGRRRDGAILNYSNRKSQLGQTAVGVAEKFRGHKRPRVS